MKISVVFTTYNSPKWLEKVIWGFSFQEDREFELVIADDGSRKETSELIEKYKAVVDFDIKHIWHEDEGFRKCRILNKAILACDGEYIIVTDGDCIPRSDFVAVHRRYAEPGYFLSGGYFKLPISTSEGITQEDIAFGRCFDKAWLLKNGMKPSVKFMKLTAGPFLSKVYNTLTLTKRSWNGHNSSCFMDDALKVNGFDERMKYGGLDAEFGGRLLNAGLKVKQIRYSAICVHLDHSRGYANPEDMARNRVIRQTSIKNKLVETPAGIKQLGFSE